MKIFSILTTIFLVVLVFTGCKKEKDWVEINSLHVETDTLFIKQKMKVWMSVESNNLQDVSYQWSCDSGKLTQPQGLSEMTWEAPVTPGKYIISCTVKIDGSSETREHEVYVAPYLFMDDASSIFNNAPVISNSAGTITRKVETVNGYSNGYYELNFKENASTNETRYVSYLFNNIKAPFSCAAKLGLIMLKGLIK